MKIRLWRRKGDAHRRRSSLRVLLSEPLITKTIVVMTVRDVAASSVDSEMSNLLRQTLYEKEQETLWENF